MRMIKERGLIEGNMNSEAMDDEVAQDCLGLWTCCLGDTVRGCDNDISDQDVGPSFVRVSNAGRGRSVRGHILCGIP